MDSGGFFVAFLLMAFSIPFAIGFSIKVVRMFWSNSARAEFVGHPIIHLVWGVMALLGFRGMFVLAQFWK